MLHTQYGARFAEQTQLFLYLAEAIARAGVLLQKGLLFLLIQIVQPHIGPLLQLIAVALVVFITGDDLGKMMPHPRPVLFQLLQVSRPVIAAHGQCHPRLRGSVFRQQLGLFIVKGL